MDLDKMPYEKIKKDKELLTEYKNILLDFSADILARKIIKENYGDTIEDIYLKIEEAHLNNTSHSYFPNDIVFLYPGIKELHTTKNIICDFSTDVIRKGKTYLYYRPLLYNITNNSTYVLKDTLKISPYYECYLPQNIIDFEDLDSKIAGNIEDDEIKYSELNRKYGSLSLRKLKRK